MSLYNSIPKLGVIATPVEEVITSVKETVDNSIEQLENNQGEILNEDFKDETTEVSEDEKIVEINYDLILKSYQNPIALSNKIKGKTVVSINSNIKGFIKHISEQEFENGYLSQKDLIKVLQMKVEQDTNIKFTQSKSKEVFNKLNFNFKNRKRNSNVSVDFNF